MPFECKLTYENIRIIDDIYDIDDIDDVIALKAINKKLTARFFVKILFITLFILSILVVFIGAISFTERLYFFIRENSF